MGQGILEQIDAHPQMLMAEINKQSEAARAQQQETRNIFLKAVVGYLSTVKTALSSEIVAATRASKDRIKQWVESRLAQERFLHRVITD